MKRSYSVFSALIGSALLAACGGNHTGPSAFVPATGAQWAGGPAVARRSATEKVLYRFQGGKADGAFPQGGLLDLDGALYGTTVYGGGPTCADYENSPGCGTVFAIDSSGATYKVLHRFPHDGVGGTLPAGALTYTNGTLYGTTQWGGSATPCHGNTGCGSVFALDPSGKDFSIVHAFNGNDGYAIYAGVVASKGALYGAALGYGAHGAVYRLSHGKLRILHAFTGTDGNFPIVAPIVAKNVLYGVTPAGGNGPCNSPWGTGCGMIYALDTNGNGYRVLHSFSGKDGAFPDNVLAVNGVLYGTTGAGGGTNCSNPSAPTGCGVFFRMKMDGRDFKVLYRFNSGKDGNSPNALWAYDNGTFYGDNSFGGNAACKNGCGTVFAVDTAGRYTVLYRFKGGTDGANPSSYGPIELNGSLYGVTVYGGGMGCGGNGCGTVFEVQP